MTETIVIPGQPLTTSGNITFKAGAGTYTRANVIFASLLGKVVREGGVSLLTPV